MRILKNKKGISDIIAIVMIISLTVVSTGLVWSYIKPTISNLSPELNCVQAQINQYLEINKACYNSSTQDVELTFSRNFNYNERINKIDFSITLQDGSVKRYYCGADCNGAEIPSPGEEKKYYFSVPHNPNEIYISIDSCNLDNSQIENC